MSQPWVLFSDFNCPFCYAMHELVLAQGVMDTLQWRGVQHAPHLPTPMARWNGRLLEELRQEVAMVGRLAPDLPMAVPPGKPNTKSAIAPTVQVMIHLPREGRELIRRFYQAFWHRGLDISDPQVQRGVLKSLNLDHILPEENLMALDIVERWEEEWAHTGHSGVPLLVRPDGAILNGLARESEVKCSERPKKQDGCLYGRLLWGC